MGWSLHSSVRIFCCQYLDLSFQHKIYSFVYVACTLYWNPEILKVTSRSCRCPLPSKFFLISTSTHLKVIDRGLCGRHRCEASKARPSAFILFHSFNRRLVYCYTFALPKKNKNVPWSPVNAEEFDIDKDLCLCTDDGFFVLQLRFQVAVLLGLLNVCKVRKLLLEGKIEWIEWINRKMNAYISVIRFNSFSHLIVWLWLQRSYFSSCDKEFYDTRWAETPAVSSVLISQYCWWIFARR